MTTGRTESLHVTPSHRAPVEGLEEARFVAGYGIEGDRHASEQPGRQDYQVLMIDVETLKEFGLKPGDVREQVTTSGFDVGVAGARTGGRTGVRGRRQGVAPRDAVPADG